MKIQAPDLGVDSAEVAEVLVSVGDAVRKDQSLLLVESDKASVEVPAPADGVIREILVNVGDSISQGAPLFEMEEGQSASSDTPTDATPAGSETQDATPVASESQENPANDAPSEEAAQGEQSYNLPDLGVDSAEVAEVLVSVGDAVRKDQSLLLVESDKASVEVPAPADGVVTQILVKAGDSVSSGQPFVTLQAKGQKTAAPSAQAAAPETPKAQAAQETKPSSSAPKAPEPSAASDKLSESEVNAKARDVYAGPAVRKLARQLGVDISAVSGSAAHGRILKEDLFAFVKNIVQNTAKAPQSQAATGSARSGLPPLPDMSNKEIWGDIEEVELTRLQKVSIPQLNYNTYLPQVTQFDLADITDTEALRNALKAEFKAQGVGLTILAFIVKAVAHALIQNPKFNCHLSDDNTKIVVRKSVHMGIAVATDDGLIVPVIKNAQDKGIKQIAIEIGELAKKARDKKLTAKELQGASFTISSQGNLGGTAFTPLVNWPQVGILGVSEASFQPRWNAASKSFEPRLMLPLSLSYDHRVINGADAAVFTRYIATLLADPRRVLL